MLKIFALLVFGLTVPVQLAAEVTFFGQLNANYSRIEANGLRQSLLDDQGTRLGVYWAKYLDAKFEARYLIEAASGLAAEDELVSELRQAWFGVRGDFGEFRLGRHLSPARIALDPVDLFADQAADQNAVLESEVRHEKSVAYINRFDGIGYAVVLSANDDDNNRISQDVLVNYKTELLYVAAAYLRGHDRRRTLRLGGHYQFPAGFHLGMAFEQLDDKRGNSGHEAYLLNAGYQLERTQFKIQAGRNEADAGGYAETLLGLGLDHSLSPTVKLQAQYSVNKHRDHSAADRERVLSLGLSVKF